MTLLSGTEWTGSEKALSRSGQPAAYALAPVRMRRFSAWALALMVGLGVQTGCVSKQDIKTADALRELGLSYLNEGNNEGALAELIKARDLNPKDARIHHELGLAFFAKGLDKQAETEMLKAIKLDPKLSECRLNLASLYMATERHSEAVDQLKLVTEDYLYRSPARAWNNLGWAYQQLGRNTEAARAYQKALQIAPNFCQALHNASILERQAEKVENAAIFAERAVNSCPEDLRFRYQLGTLQASLKKVNEAQANFQLVADKDPTGELGAQARAALKSLH